MPRIVKIQFHTAGKIYDFAAGTLELTPGDRVVVETERGRSIALVVTPPQEFDSSVIPEGLKSVLRLADPADLESAARNAAREKDAREFCLRKIKERKMEMKLVKAEYLFDGSKVIFYFTADGRVDFRDLVKDLAHQFHTRIEMRQIGVRDEAKIIGGIGICGRELCCSSFLREFEPVSVKMAKEQNLALNPTKISGQCGRLLCCLGYEYETYCSLRKCLPKCGKRVRCGNTEGEVVKLNILEGTVTVRSDDGQAIELRGDAINAEDISDRPKPLRKESGKERDRAEGKDEKGASGPERREQDRGKDRDRREPQPNEPQGRDRRGPRGRDRDKKEKK